MECHDEDSNSDLAYVTVSVWRSSVRWLTSLVVHVGLRVCYRFVQNYAGFLGLGLVLGESEQIYIYGDVHSWWLVVHDIGRSTVNLACILGCLAGWRWIFISEGAVACLIAEQFFPSLPPES